MLHQNYFKALWLQGINIWMQKFFLQNLAGKVKAEYLAIEAMVSSE